VTAAAEALEEALELLDCALSSASVDEVRRYVEEAVGWVVWAFQFLGEGW
jgi:hypothetical protein